MTITHRSLAAIQLDDEGNHRHVQELREADPEDQAQAGRVLQYIRRDDLDTLVSS